LAVVKLRVDHRISEQDFAQIFIFNASREPKRSLDVLLDFILNFLRQLVHGLLLVSFELATNELSVDFEDFEPKSLTLPFDSVLVSPQEGLLVDLAAQNLIEVFRDKQNIPQRLI